MNLNKLTKAQLIDIIFGLQEELVHAQSKAESVEEDDSLPWKEQTNTTTHAQIMAERMAKAKAAAMASGRAVKA